MNWASHLLRCTFSPPASTEHVGQDGCQCFSDRSYHWLQQLYQTFTAILSSKPVLFFCHTALTLRKALPHLKEAAALLQKQLTAMWSGAACWKGLGCCSNCMCSCKGLWLYQGCFLAVKVPIHHDAWNLFFCICASLSLLLPLAGWYLNK